MSTHREWNHNSVQSHHQLLVVQSSIQKGNGNTKYFPRVLEYGMLNPALAVKHAKTDENNQVRPVMTELWWGEKTVCWELVIRHVLAGCIVF